METSRGDAAAATRIVRGAAAARTFGRDRRLRYCAVVLACLVLFLNGFVTQMPAGGRVVPCVTVAFLVAVSLERLKMPWGFTTWYPAIAAACAISFILTFLYGWLEVLCAVFEEPEAPVVEEQRGHGELLKAALTSFGGGLFLWFALRGNPRKGHGRPTGHPHGISTSQPRRRRDPSPRNIHVAAAASPRPVSAGYHAGFTDSRSRSSVPRSPRS